MGKFQIVANKEDACVYLKFSGEIDEDSDFSMAVIDGATTGEIDFQEVKSINSCGVRQLCKWVEGISKDTKISYLNCPEIIVSQFNMVAGLLKKGISVRSFYTPYFCEPCNLHTEVLFSAGKEFTGVNVKTPGAVKCSKCQGPTEIDVIEGSYFRFLQYQG